MVGPSSSESGKNWVGSTSVTSASVGVGSPVRGALGEMRELIAANIARVTVGIR